MNAPGRRAGHAAPVVLVTRPAGRAEGLTRRLAACGLRVVARPTIAFDPPRDPRIAEEAVREIERYDWILFTSTNGVRFFSELHERIQGDRVPAASLAAIGPATARALEARGWSPAVVARESHAEGLARSLVDRVRGGERVLLVRPEVAREVVANALAALGAKVDAVPFYRTIAAPEAPLVAREVIDGRFAAAVFSSPSTFGMLLDSSGPERASLLRALETTAVVAIGEVTAAALGEHGVAVGRIAAEPTEDAIVNALRELLGR